MTNISAFQTKSMQEVLCSKDWMGEYQPSHEDIDPQLVFESSPAIAVSLTNAAVKDEHHVSLTATTFKTDWASEYYNVLLGQSPSAGDRKSVV